MGAVSNAALSKVQEVLLRRLGVQRSLFELKEKQMLKINPKAKRFVPRGSDTDGAGRRLYRAKAWSSKPGSRESRREWKFLARKEEW